MRKMLCLLLATLFLLAPVGCGKNASSAGSSKESGTAMMIDNGGGAKTITTDDGPEFVDKGGAITNHVKLLSAKSTSDSFSTSPIAGDINGDKAVNLKDITTLARVIANATWSGLDYSEALADLDQNGTADLKDITLLARYVAGWNVVLPPAAVVNTIGTQLSSGVTMQGNWIYYCKGTGIYKIKTDGTGFKKLWTSDKPADNINVIGDWIYYTTSGLYKIKTDGTGSELIYGGAGYDLVIYEGAAYMFRSVFQRLDLADLTESQVTYLGRCFKIVDGYVYTATGRTKLSDNSWERLFIHSSDTIHAFCPAGNYVFYDCEDGLYRVDIRDKSVTKLPKLGDLILSDYEVVNRMQYSNGYLYYTSTDDKFAIYRMNPSDLTVEKISFDQTFYYEHVIIGDYLFPYNQNEFINLKTMEVTELPS